MRTRTLSCLKSLLSLAALATATFSAGSADAVGTRTFDMSSMEDLASGDLTGVAVDGRGVVRAGLQLGKTTVDGAESAFQSVLLPDGSVLIGTGSEGKIMRVSNGQVSVAATTGQMAVSAMTLAWNGDVIAGSFPAGKLYRLPKGAGKGEAAKEWGSKLEGAEAIWDMAYDEKSKSLFVATGPEGKVFRIDDSGRPQVHYDADDSHVTSLAMAPDGKLLVGTSGKAILYKVDAPGRANVVYDFDADDVSNIAIGKKGEIWVTANKYGGGFSLPKGPGGFSGAGSARPGRGGEGLLYRFKDGVAEEMESYKKSHFTSLDIGDDGTPYMGTGFEGHVLTVNEDHLERLLADVEERQIATVVMSGKKRLLVTSDPVTVREIKGEGGPDAVWTSKVLDAGLPATWGLLTWRGTGTIEVQTRSGNTQDPDSSWSAWSNAITAPGKVGSPRGRYIQMRARFARDAKATFSEIRLHFVTDNARAIITNVTAEGRVQKSGKLQTGLQQSGGSVAKPSSTVNIRWDVENPDKDDLRYRVFYRLESQQIWRDAIKPTEVFTRTSLDWDTTSLPEGLYRMKVEATDELVNSPDKVTKHSLESGLVLVDNTAPVFKTLAMNGRKLTGEASDGLGPIVRIELALAGTDDWRPIAPSDGIFDEASEKFEQDVSAIVPAGSRMVGVRVYDQAGNSVLKELEAK
jgi:hypothetical protein